ncbi:MAG: glycosyltransferase family 4 protein [Desulfobacter sp.]|nr:MAG: glycosyltransferase family 4 protein [Desulfobacter sp.]
MIEPIMSKKMRILVIGPVIAPHLYDRVQCFARLGHQVALVTNTPDYTIPGVDSLIIKGLPLGGMYRTIALSRMVGFYSLVKRFDPDIIMVHYAAGLWNWMAATCSRPLVVSVMGGDVLFEQTGPSRLERRLTASLLNRADWVLAESDYLKNAVGKMGRKGGITTFTWGVNSRFLPGRRREDTFRKRYRIKEDAKIVLSPRGMFPIYNIDIIVRGFAGICRRIEASLLLSTVYVDPRYKKQIENLITDLGIEDKVVILPELADEDIPALYGCADVAVSIPSSDGMPRSFFEASACNTPMIMANLENYRDVIIHRENAYCVELDAQEVTDALWALLESKALHKRIGDNAARTLDEMQARSKRHLSFIESMFFRFAGRAKHICFLKAVIHFFRLVMLLLLSPSIVSRTDQPVFDSIPHYIESIVGRGPSKK